MRYPDRIGVGAGIIGASLLNVWLQKSAAHRPIG